MNRVPESDGSLVGQSPLDLEPLPPVATTRPEAVAKAVERARKAQAEWARQPFSKRASLLQKAAQSMLQRRSEALDLVRMEMGKHAVDGLFSEALGPLETLQGFARLVKSHTKPRKVGLNPIAFPRKRAFVQMVPRGVIGIIAPWNFPIAGLYRSLFPALLSGNAVVVKPSEYTPRSSSWFCHRLSDFLPSHLVQTVIGGATIGEALVLAETDSLVFTGSTRTGRKVAAQAASLGVYCSVETGGNDAAIVLEDANLERTAAGLTQWSLQNSGQSCGALEVAYVDRAVADALTERLERAWKTLKVGPGPFAEVDISPLAHEGQLQIVEEHVRDALDRGAVLRCGGARTQTGFWYPPTLLDHCTPQMRIVQEETFGPVLAVCRIDGPAAGVRAINRGQFGLTASIWTNDLERAERLGKRLNVGTVTVNNHGLTGAIVDLPWSGTKASGPGVANGIEGLASYLRPQSWLLDQASNPEPYWLPYDEAAWHLGDSLADLQSRRIDRAWRIPFLLRKRIQKIRQLFSDPAA